MTPRVRISAMLLWAVLRLIDPMHLPFVVRLVCTEVSLKRHRYLEKIARYGVPGGASG
jgi:hypothetical protein